MADKTETSKGEEVTSVGPVGACRLFFRGIPILTSGPDNRWASIRTPWFPLAFFAATAILYSFVSAPTYYGYWVLPGRPFPNFIWSELFITAVAALAIESFMFVVQFAAAVFFLSCAGLDDTSAKSTATRALYLAAILNVFSAPFLPVIDASVGGVPQSSGLQIVAWCAIMAVGAVRAATIAFGVARSDRGSIPLGIICALFGPEIGLLLGRIIGPVVILLGFLSLFAAPVLLWYRERRRHPDGFCQTCGYDLTGNVSGRCSECGELIDEQGD